MSLDAEEAKKELQLLLKQTRESREVTSKAQAARDLEVSRMTYDMWERGAWVPDLDKAEQIAAFTGQSVADTRRLLLQANDVPLPPSELHQEQDAELIAAAAGIPIDVFNRWSKLDTAKRAQAATVVRSLLDSWGV